MQTDLLTKMLMTWVQRKCCKMSTIYIFFCPPFQSILFLCSLKRFLFASYVLLSRAPRMHERPQGLESKTWSSAEAAMMMMMMIVFLCSPVPKMKLAKFPCSPVPLGDPLLWKLAGGNVHNSRDLPRSPVLSDSPAVISILQTTREILL